jgi:hypothetical protein
MLVTLPGMLTEAKFVQPANADAPILVTLFGIVMLFKPLLPNAYCPILVTLEGMLTEVR